MSYKIITDAAVDFADYYWDETEAHVIPMNYDLDGEEELFIPGKDHSVKEAFYDKLLDKSVASTTQITPFQFEEVFRQYLDQGLDVIYVAFSASLSSTYESSLVAKNNLEEEYPDRKIVCVDSQCCTGGLGLMVQEMEENKAQGMTIEENKAYCEEEGQKFAHYFIVSDLMYLARGGRLSTLAGIAGTALRMKPLLLMDHEGKLKTFKKARGFKGALRELCKIFDEFQDEETTKKFWITYTSNREIAEYMEECVRDIGFKGEVELIPMSPIIGCHIGPDFVGTFYHTKDERNRYQEGAK